MLGLPGRGVRFRGHQREPDRGGGGVPALGLWEPDRPESEPVLEHALDVFRDGPDYFGHPVPVEISVYQSTNGVGTLPRTPLRTG